MDISTNFVEVLHLGKMNLKGEFAWGSNYTFLTQVEYNGLVLLAVYKPSRGERLLWDFPAETLANREVAAFKVSEALGWNLVPPTVLRLTAPLGPGSLQLFVEHNPEYHYFNFSDTDRQRLRPVVLFDIVINNADRKGSHILRGLDGHLWLIDHGVSFHVEEKLRTVIWDFVGESILQNLIGDLSGFSQKLKSSNEDSSSLVEDLLVYMDRSELDALVNRVDRLVADGFFPNPDTNRRFYPWPQI